MSFYQGNFSQRFGVMGDIAETAFERFEPRHHRLGYNRPPFQTTKLPLMLRCIPDYMTRDGMTEVMGIGRDKTLKLKVEKLRSLTQWLLVAPVSLFVYDSHRKKCWLAPIADWEIACAEHGVFDRFHDDNRAFIRLNSDSFPCEGVKLDGEQGIQQPNLTTL